MSFKLEVSDYIGYIIIDTDNVNTIDTNGMRTLISVFDEINKNTKVRLAILQSRKPGMFSHGMNPSFLIEQSMEGRKQLFLTLMDLIVAADNLQVPLIADINGPALAGGAVLALLGDFAIANGDHAKVCFSEVKVGLPVPEPIFELLRRRCSEVLVKDMILLGKNMSATDLLSAGIVIDLYHSEKDRDEVLGKLAARVQRLDRRVVAQTLKSSKTGMVGAIERFRQNVDEEFSAFLTEDFLIKGLKAVLKGESPKFG